MRQLYSDTAIIIFPTTFWDQIEENHNSITDIMDGYLDSSKYSHPFNDEPLLVLPIVIHDRGTAVLILDFSEKRYSLYSSAKDCSINEAVMVQNSLLVIILTQC